MKWDYDCSTRKNWSKSYFERLGWNQSYCARFRLTDTKEIVVFDVESTPMIFTEAALTQLLVGGEMVVRRCSIVNGALVVEDGVRSFTKKEYLDYVQYSFDRFDSDDTDGYYTSAPVELHRYYISKGLSEEAIVARFMADGYRYERRDAAVQARRLESQLFMDGVKFDKYSLWGFKDFSYDDYTLVWIAFVSGHTWICYQGEWSFHSNRETQNWFTSKQYQQIAEYKKGV